MKTNKKEYRYTTPEGKEKTITVAETVDLSVLIEIYKSVCECVFANGSYNPQAKEITMNGLILQAYTSLKNLEPKKVYEYMVNTNLMDIVKMAINLKQLEDLERWINDAINYEMHKGELSRLLAMLAKEAQAEKGVEGDINVDTNKHEMVTPEEQET